MADSETVFHVVCRDCERETLAGSRRDARLTAEDHAGDTEHRVEFARVSDRADAGDDLRRRIDATDD